MDLMMFLVSLSSLMCFQFYLYRVFTPSVISLSHLDSDPVYSFSESSLSNSDMTPIQSYWIPWLILIHAKIYHSFTDLLQRYTQRAKISTSFNTFKCALFHNRITPSPFKLVYAATEQ